MKYFLAFALTTASMMAAAQLPSIELELLCVSMVRVGKEIKQNSFKKTLVVPDGYTVDLHNQWNVNFQGYHFFITGADEGAQLLVVENSTTKQSVMTMIEPPYQIDEAGFTFSVVSSKKAANPRAGLYDIYGGEALGACTLSRTE